MNPFKEEPVRFTCEESQEVFLFCERHVLWDNRNVCKECFNKEFEDDEYDV